MADAEASFNTSMDSISFGLISARGFVGSLFASDKLVDIIGKPSTTYRGWLLAEIEEVPLILIFIACPTFPLPDSTITPGALPCIADSKLGAGKFSTSFGVNFEIDPVMFLFTARPYPTTTTSLKLLSVV